MNFFTPQLGPPLTVGTSLDEWRSRVTDYLNGLRERLDVEMIAYISHAAQLGPGVVPGSAIVALTTAQATANLAIGGVTQLTFSVSPGRPGLSNPSCSSAGWFVSLASASTTSVVVNVFNNSGSTAGATVNLSYL